MKNARRIVTSVFAVIAVAVGMLLVVPGTASAHGYVSSPASRQAQCAQHVVECGPIQWEPQSVEGPKGLRDCAGGNEQFAELRDDSKGWQVHPVGQTVPFTWTFTAAHRTTNFEYYIGDTKVGDFSGNDSQPPNGLTHDVNLSGYSGQQKLLAVWNIADTPNAFYACVDLQVG
jgi:predicted carbohydrate-binding protein with CBM5 and CBM33 domain